MGLGIKQSVAHLGTRKIADAKMIGRSSMSLPSSSRCPYIQIQAVLGDIGVRIPHFLASEARKIFISVLNGWMDGVDQLTITHDKFRVDNVRTSLARRNSAFGWHPTHRAMVRLEQVF